MRTVEKQSTTSKEECTSSVAHIRDALYVLNGKWKLPLIFTISESPKRFGELQRALDGITPKILLKELKELQMNNFIVRKVYDTTPVTILYEATAYSDTLKSVLHELRAWGAQHREIIKQGMRDSAQKN